VQDFRVTFHEKELRPVSSARDLGMEFDECLSYDEHITLVVSKCTKSLCQINRVKHILDSRTLIMIINALVVSKLYYCSSVWANTTKKNIAKLQTVQNFAARIVTGTRKYDHITPVLQQLNSYLFLICCNIKILLWLISVLKDEHHHTLQEDSHLDPRHMVGRLDKWMN
jgi:hypothetical protein